MRWFWPTIKQQAALLRLFDEFGRVLCAGGNRLVDHHVFAGLQRLDADRRVQVVGQRNRDNVDVFARQQLFVVGDKSGTLNLSTASWPRSGETSATATTLAAGCF
jgi:hypothetical protein